MMMQYPTVLRVVVGVEVLLRLGAFGLESKFHDRVQSNFRVHPILVSCKSPYCTDDNKMVSAIVVVEIWRVCDLPCAVSHSSSIPFALMSSVRNAFFGNLCQVATKSGLNGGMVCFQR